MVELLSLIARETAPGILSVNPVKNFKNESKWSFVIELLIFGLLSAISAWPIIHTAEALLRFDACVFWREKKSARRFFRHGNVTKLPLSGPRERW